MMTGVSLFCFFVFFFSRAGLAPFDGGLAVVTSEAFGEVTWAIAAFDQAIRIHLTGSRACWGLTFLNFTAGSAF